jgi:hypothetical protein
MGSMQCLKSSIHSDWQCGEPFAGYIEVIHRWYLRRTSRSSTHLPIYPSSLFIGFHQISSTTDHFIAGPISTNLDPFDANLLCQVCRHTVKAMSGESVAFQPSCTMLLPRNLCAYLSKDAYLDEHICEISFLQYALKSA